MLDARDLQDTPSQACRFARALARSTPTLFARGIATPSEALPQICRNPGAAFRFICERRAAVCPPMTLDFGLRPLGLAGRHRPAMRRANVMSRHHLDHLRRFRRGPDRALAVAGTEHADAASSSRPCSASPAPSSPPSFGQTIGWYRADQGAGFIAATVGAVLVLFIWNRLVASGVIGDPGNREALTPISRSRA